MTNSRRFPVETVKVSNDSVDRFEVAPDDQGQTVEYAYAWTEDSNIVQRRTDRSDGSVTYTYLEIKPDSVDDIDVPNGYPPGAADVISKAPCEIVF